MLWLLDVGALVRVPQEGDGLRVVDLFAGIGGWSDTIVGLWGDVVTSVEIDECKAKALARTLALPMIRKVEGTAEGNFVFCGDVFDLQWTKASWDDPFTVVLWSSPCVSWSQAGYAAGLDSTEGMLLIRSVALLGLLRPCASVGENVAAVLGHQHFPVVQRVAKELLGHELQAKVLELQTWAPMIRKRVFLFDTVSKGVVLRPMNLPADRRKAVRAVITDVVGLHDAQVPEEALSMLQDYDLLPMPNRRRLNVGFGPQEVLRSRIERGFLPVLMASYRRQHRLPVGLLKSKGLFTFLVQEVHDDKPRYLDCFEAARHMGFGLGLCLPSDPDVAAHAVGNTVAPIIQAFEVTNSVVAQVWPKLALDDGEARKKIMTMLYGQGDLARFTRSKHEDFAFLVPDVPVDWQVRSAQMLFFWGDGCLWVPEHEAIIRQESIFVPFGYAWLVERCVWIKEGLGRLMHVQFQKGMLTGDNFSLKVQPWHSIDDVVQVFAGFDSDLRRQVGLRTDQKLASLTSQKQWKVNGVSLKVNDGEVMLVFDNDRRIGKGLDELSLLGMVDWLYPFELSGFVAEIWDVRAATSVTPTEKVRSGIFQVLFGAFPVWIAPFGMVVCEPTQSVRHLQERLAIQYLTRHWQVELRVANKVLGHATTVALAAKLGPLVTVAYGDGAVLENDSVVSVDTKEIQFSPYGVIQCKEEDTIAQVQVYFAARFFGGRDVVRITSNGTLVDPSVSVFQADQRGCLRVRVFPMRGGVRSLVATESVLAELLTEHGVNIKAVDGKVRELCEKQGMIHVTHGTGLRRKRLTRGSSSYPSRNVKVQARRLTHCRRMILGLSTRENRRCSINKGQCRLTCPSWTVMGRRRRLSLSIRFSKEFLGCTSVSTMKESKSYLRSRNELTPPRLPRFSFWECFRRIGFLTPRRLNRLLSLCNLVVRKVLLKQ